MPLGQSYVVFKVVSKGVEGVAKLFGAEGDGARVIGKSIGTYVGGWTAIITVDPAGGAAIAAETVYTVNNALGNSGDS